MEPVGGAHGPLPCFCLDRRLLLVTKASANWDIACSPGQRYPDEGALGHPLPFLALCWWFSCFFESQPWHTLLGEVEMFPIEDPWGSLGESASPVLSGIASDSRKLSLWLCCSALHSYGTFFQGLACVLAACQICSCPVNTVKSRTLQN